MAHDAGEPKSHTPPVTMAKYRSGGTPWTVIIDPAGRVVYNHFHIDSDEAVRLIRSLSENGGQWKRDGG